MILLCRSSLPCMEPVRLRTLMAFCLRTPGCLRMGVDGRTCSGAAWKIFVVKRSPTPYAAFYRYLCCACHAFHPSTGAHACLHAFTALNGAYPSSLFLHRRRGAGRTDWAEGRRHQVSSAECPAFFWQTLRAVPPRHLPPKRWTFDDVSVGGGWNAADLSSARSAFTTFSSFYKRVRFCAYGCHTVGWD